MDIAYTVVLSAAPGKRIGLVKLNESGYYECDGWDYAGDDLETVKERVKELNSKIGVPEDVAQAATYGSLFGWRVPAAARAVQWFKTQSAAHEAAL